MIIIQIFYLILPVLVGGIIRVFSQKLGRKMYLDSPLDFGLQFLNQPLFGRTKTWAGLLLSGLVITLVILLQNLLYQFETFKQLTLINYDLINPFALALALTLGYNLGELPTSFIKRRLNIPSSYLPKNKGAFIFLVVEQLDSVLGAIIGLNLVAPQTQITNFLILAVGATTHAVIDFLLYRVGVKTLKLR